MDTIPPMTVLADSGHALGRDRVRLSCISTNLDGFSSRFIPAPFRCGNRQNRLNDRQLALQQMVPVQFQAPQQAAVTSSRTGRRNRAHARRLCIELNCSCFTETQKPIIIETAVSTFVPQGMGWQPDLPDARDYTFHHLEILPLLRQLKRSRRKSLPDEVDLRRDSEGEYFTDPEDQGPLNSSSAFAVLSLVEYFERRIRGRTFEGSKRFLYKVTRNRIAKRSRVIGDTGSDLRSTLKVLVQFGVPPEEFWPYDIEKFDEEPTAFLYALAKPFPDLLYFRLDEPNADGETIWATVKSFLAAGFPIAFGFPVPTSLTADANVPYRPDLDGPRGGQSIIAVGYKANHYGPRQDALLIRSSWGCKWGDNGNGWLPVAFVRKKRARDFWTVISENWRTTTELSLASVIDSMDSKCPTSVETPTREENECNQFSRVIPF